MVEIKKCDSGVAGRRDLLVDGVPILCFKGGGTSPADVKALSAYVLGLCLESLYKCPGYAHLVSELKKAS